MIKNNKAGRPPFFKTPEEMWQKIEDYFDTCTKRIRKYSTAGKITKINDPAPMHIAGLCAYLGITNETLNQYQKQPEFSESIAYAKQRCEAYAVDACFEGKKGNKADFILQNNFGWKNRIQQEVNNDLRVKTVYITPEEIEAYERHIDKVINEN